MLNVKTSGKVTSSVRDYFPIGEEDRKLLNGMTLAAAIESGHIVNDDTLKFMVITSKYSDGQEYDFGILRSNKGDIQISSPLYEGEITDWLENLGDLVFQQGISTKAGGGNGKSYFRLQKPGEGWVKQTASEFMPDKFAAA